MSYDPLSGEVTGTPEGCPSCLEERARAATIEADLLAAERELRRVRRELGAAQAELRRQEQEAPEMKAAQALWRYYLMRSGKEDSRTKFGDKRVKAVLARLREGRRASYIARAIDGLVEFAYVNPESKVRYDDIELVCRNEVNLERYHDLAEARAARTVLGRAWKIEFGEEV